ncbi:MAG: hypothetical protein J6U38_06400, partial [Clostridia bacterium]|nr:hypothetical protein [Clostridia bacterium]
KQNWRLSGNTQGLSLVSQTIYFFPPWLKVAGSIAESENTFAPLTWLRTQKKTGAARGAGFFLNRFQSISN